MVARDFVIDPDPQDMISRINRVGMLLGFWSGCLLGLFIGQSVIGNWEGRERGVGRGKSGMSCEEGRIRDGEDSTSCLCSTHLLKNHPFEDFTDISGTTHPNLHLTHTVLRQFLTPSLSPVIDQAIFPFISYFSHDESLCFRFITHFSF